jgi:flagellum-specific peptidoglycan hydrolase FlgJ
MLCPILRVMPKSRPILRTLVTLIFFALLGVGFGALRAQDGVESTALAASNLEQPSVDPEVADQQRLLRLSDEKRWVVLDSQAGSLEALFVDSANPVLAKAAASQMVSAQQRDWPAGYRRDFLGSLSEQAIQSGVENQLPPSVTLAQAVLESGWGRSGLAKKHNNLFGLKSGAHSDGVVLSSWEGGGAERIRVASRFRAYSDWSESLVHHNLLISTDSRYETARDAWQDWEAYIDELAPIYATDPDYVERVSQIVERYGLDAWDSLVAQRVAKHQP